MDLVTGATGFIGMNLVEELGKKEKVRCLVRKTSPRADFLRKNNGVIAVGSLEDKASLFKATNGIETVFHLAASLGNDEEELQRVNVDGTQNLVEASKANKVKRIIYVSTYLAGEKYKSAYGKSKRQGEEIVKKSGIKFAIIRPSVVYGPMDERNLGRIIAMVNSMAVVPVIAGIKMQPVFVKDVVQAIIAASEKKEALGKTYNAVGPQLLTFAGLVSGIENASGVKKPKIPIPLFLVRPVVFLYSLLSGNRRIGIRQIDDLAINTKISHANAAKDLGFSPISFEKGIKLTCGRSP